VNVLDDDTTTPLAAEVARALLERGWAPLPIPARSKGAPPTGFTGYAGKYPTATQVQSWTWDGNIAIRLPPDVVGVDVDVYHGGDKGLDELQDRYGVLPATVWSTSREDGSGIALFRVPVGTTLATDPATGIDMIQAHHRYMVVHPSLHPEGRVYQWIDEADQETYLDGPPEPDELPELPWAWIEGLTVSKSDAARAATPDEVRAFVAEHTRQTRPAALRGVERRLAEYVGARHDTLVEVACWALREAAAGYYTADAAIDVLHRWWRRVMDDPARRDGGEFGSAVMWAVAQVAAEPERVAELEAQLSKSESPTPTPPPNIDPETGEIIEQSWTNLPEAFWHARPAFEHIRAAAHARMVSADAVLLAVLARVVMLTPPGIALPAIVGSRVSLNLFVSIIDASGGGKSAAVAVARELVPHRRDDIADPILPSSGEGLIEAYMGTRDAGDGKKERAQTKTAGLAWVDEGQGLLAQSERSGSTIMETIRSAWMGGDLGQHNATEERRRWLKAHKYRLSMVVGFQLAYAASLIADGEGGTPQRFTFALASDPSIDPHAEWPGELDFEPRPTFALGDDITFDCELVAGIRERRLQRSRGTLVVDPLDTHADLRRMKLAAAVALLEERTHVGAEDWELAVEIDQTSCAVRSLAVEHARSQAARAEHARALSQANREALVGDATEARALDLGSRVIARKVHRVGGPTSRRDLHAAAGRHRTAVTLEALIDRAVDLGWIVEQYVEADHHNDTGQRWVPGDTRPA
jgi:hypothetical protein